MKMKHATAMPTLRVFGLVLALIQPIKVLSAPIKVILDRPPVTLNPLRAVDVHSQRIISLFFPGLVQQAEDGTLRPQQAKKWSQGQDHNLWVFTLEQNSPPASDWALCVTSYLKSQTLLPLPRIKRAWASEAGKLNIFFDQPVRQLPHDLVSLRYFKFPNHPPCTLPQDATTLPSGTGPIQLLKIDGKTLWDPSPKNSIDLSGVRLIFVREEVTRILLLKNKGAHAAWNALPASSVKTLLKLQGFSYSTSSSAQKDFIFMNSKRGPLKDERVRRALSLSIPRDLIVKTRLSPTVEALSGYPYRPVEAKALLDEAGYPTMKDGSRFELVYRSTTHPDGLDKAMLIKMALKEINVNLKIQQVETAIFSKSLLNAPPDLYSTRVLQFNNAELMSSHFHSQGQRNYFSLGSKELDSALEQWRQNPENIKFKAEVNRLVDSQHLALPLWQWTHGLLITPEVTLKPIDSSRLANPLEIISSLRFANE